MAFADSIRTANYSREDVAERLEALLISHDTDSATSQSSSTGSYLDLLTCTVSVSGGNYVYIVATGDFSKNENDGLVGFRLFRGNSVDLTGTMWINNDLTSTAGQMFGMHISYLDTAPGTGSVEYDLQWHNNGSGTRYASWVKMYAWTLRQS